MTCVSRRHCNRTCSHGTCTDVAVETLESNASSRCDTLATLVQQQAHNKNTQKKTHRYRRINELAKSSLLTINSRGVSILASLCVT